MTSPVPDKRQATLGRESKTSPGFEQPLISVAQRTLAASYPSSWSLSDFLPRTEPALLDVPKVLELSSWLNHGAELITGLGKPTGAALSTADFTPTAGNEDDNAQESQIRACLAWDELLLKLMLSHIKNLNAMGVERGLGILLEA